mgnify:CR=1 FL=1
MNLMTVFFLQAPAAGPDGSMMWIMLIAMFAIMYFFMIRPQNKKQKEIANFRKSLQVNQKVITAGGIHVLSRKLTIMMWFLKLLPTLKSILIRIPFLPLLLMQTVVRLLNKQM